MKWLDALSWPLLLVLAAWMALAPLQPEPHLIEKLRWLVQGRLQRPLDIFDLLLHSTPLVLVALKFWRGRRPH
ncbi:MAG: hypothetical protein Fur007_21600 [Rhodoferax sp.]